MQFSFCKKSVFSVLFLLSFLLGTICGVLLFRCVYVYHSDWIVDYGSALFIRIDRISISCLAFALIPFVSLFLLSIFPEGYRVLPVLIAVRGCLLCYFLCLCHVGGISYGAVFCRNLFLLPLFYFVSRHIWVYRPFHREEIL